MAKSTGSKNFFVSKFCIWQKNYCYCLFYERYMTMNYVLIDNNDYVLHRKTVLLSSLYFSSLFFFNIKVDSCILMVIIIDFIFFYSIIFLLIPLLFKTHKHALKLLPWREIFIHSYAKCGGPHRGRIHYGERRLYS